MRYLWDDAKRRRNLRLRGIDFADAVGIFDGPTLEREDTREDYGEERFVAIGLACGRPLTVVYTEPGPAVRRIISARKATREEGTAYAEAYPPRS